MKYKTTKKAVNDGYAQKICVGYCNLQNLLNYENEIAYTVRREGWAADIYDFGDVAIITGYAPFGNIRPGYEICRKYDAQGEQLRCNNSLSWEERKAKAREIIKQFIEEVTQ